MTEIEYIAFAIQDSLHSAYVSVPDFPGCLCFGATISEAVQRSHDAIQEHVSTLLNIQHSVPEPRSIYDCYVFLTTRNPGLLLVIMDFEKKRQTIRPFILSVQI